MRILFVGMVNAIHAVRWTALIADQGWEIYFFPVERARLHPSFQKTTIFNPNIFPRRYPSGNEVRLLPWVSPLFLLEAKLPKILKRPAPTFSASALARIIQIYKPDLIHSLEMQHAGYLTLKAKERLGGNFPTWAMTIWGSDIYLFGRLQEHKAKIRSVLEACDYFGSESERDIHLARELGLKGKVLPVLPATGAFNLDACQKFKRPGLISERRAIFLKGYQHFAGRALVGLRALAMCADLLQGYQVDILGANPDVALAAKLFSQDTGIPVNIVSDNARDVSDDDVFSAFGRARIAIGLSISDGLPRAFLEAIIMGAFPIQSNTACADEWIVNGETGFIVPPEDPDIIADAIRQALLNDDLVDRAAEINALTARERLDEVKIKAQVVNMYQEIFAEQEK
jgi:glycosyltransferase involved in cell wall biosynthesis